MAGQDYFGAKATFDTGSGPATLYRLAALEEQGAATISRLPFSIRVLLEAALRQADGFEITPEAVKTIAQWGPDTAGKVEIPFKPARVVLQDFTGVPSVVDLAAVRSAVARLGGNPAAVNPLTPVDLVVDHSVQVDRFGSVFALFYNAEREFERNRERYEFLKWGQEAFDNFRVVPPATGIVHQVNLEYLADVVHLAAHNGTPVAYPDSLVGTDSHTTMINGLGVLGWGVGGIEAEAVMLGQPIYMLMPEVVGFRLTGELPEGATATDLVLRVTEMLRKKGVVGKFVEFFGPGLPHLSLPDRATIANMAPEYGATTGFFPVDAETLRYLIGTGRSEELVDLVERYSKEQGLFHTPETPAPEFSDTLELDMSTVVPSLSGPKRPQDRINLSDVKKVWASGLTAPVGPQSFNVSPDKASATVPVEHAGQHFELTHGSVVIAAITSCTNTSNPSVMIGAGLLAKKAVERGLDVKPWVKTSMAPGSKVVTKYLEASGLIPYLEALNFHTVGYGCTTCIGNSGPLPAPISEAIHAGDLVAAAVLSGNRNFEGRISPDVSQNYLSAPAGVVAYALAGTMDFDFATQPLGRDAEGNDVMLCDIWPTDAEVAAAVKDVVTQDLYVQGGAGIYEGDAAWQALGSATGDTFQWDDASTYVRRATYFDGMERSVSDPAPVGDARVLVNLGDFITTDHISPAGAIAPDSAAARYLRERGVSDDDFNTYGSRRGNHEVMARHLRQCPHQKSHVAQCGGGVASTFPAARFPASGMRRSATWKPAMIILAGKEYGSGSSRDWAAKGPQLQGRAP